MSTYNWGPRTPMGVAVPRGHARFVADADFVAAARAAGAPITWEEVQGLLTETGRDRRAMVVVAPAWVARVFQHRGSDRARKLAVLTRLAGDPVALALAVAHDGIDRLLEDHS